MNIQIGNNKDGKVWFDDIKIVKGNASKTLIVEEKNFYPFGLAQKGYNNVVSSSGNSTAQKFGYNGVEFEEALGLNLHEMDVRTYDPAIARFNGIDPVTHFSQGTSVAFDNNPVYYADPSGADSNASGYGLGRTGSEYKTIYNFGMGGWRDTGGSPTDNSSSSNNTAFTDLMAFHEAVNPNDIIFKNNDGDELARIVTPGEDVEVTVDTDLRIGTPIMIEPKPNADAVGVNFETSVTVGGGMHVGTGYVYFLNGNDAGNLYNYDFKGGNVGLGAGIGVSGYTSFFNRNSNVGSDLFGIKGFGGKYNGYSASFFVEGSMTWSNTKNTSDQPFPNYRENLWTWKSYSAGGGLSGGLQVDARFLMGESYNFTKKN